MKFIKGEKAEKLVTNNYHNGKIKKQLNNVIYKDKFYTYYFINDNDYFYIIKLQQKRGRRFFNYWGYEVSKMQGNEIYKEIKNTCYSKNKEYYRAKI